MIHGPYNVKLTSQLSYLIEWLWHKRRPPETSRCNGPIEVRNTEIYYWFFRSWLRSFVTRQYSWSWLKIYEIIQHFSRHPPPTDLPTVRQSSWTARNLKDGFVRLSRNIGRWYQHRLSNIPERQRPHQVSSNYSGSRAVICSAVRWNSLCS